MRRISQFLGTCSVILLVALPVTEVFGQKKKDKKPAKTGSEFAASVEEYSQIRRAKQLSGSVVSLEGNTLTLRLKIPNYEPNPNYNPNANANNQQNAYVNFQNQQWQIVQEIGRQQQAAMRATNRLALQQAFIRIQQEMMRYQQLEGQFMQRMAQQQYSPPNPNNLPYKVVTIKKDFELEIKEDAVVRKTFLGTDYDDTGNIKTYTEKEKQALRGPDRTKPGYMAKLDEVQAGTEVYLFLTPPKGVKKKDEKEDPGATVATISRPVINMIVMTGESPAGGIESSSSVPDKKKK